MGWWQEILGLGGAVLYVSVFFKSLGSDPFLLLFQRIRSLSDFLFIKNGSMKGKVYNFPLCWIKNYLTNLFLSPHTTQSSLRYVIDDVLGIYRVWIDTSDYFLNGCVESDLVNYGGEMYC